MTGPLVTERPDGTYVSGTKLGQILGRTPRTLRRWEDAGILPRPRRRFNGNAGQRWYSESEVALLAKLVQEHVHGKEGLQRLGAAIKAERDRRARDKGRTPANVRRSWKDIEPDTPEEKDKPSRWRDLSEPKPPVPVGAPMILVCPRCNKGTILTQDIAGRQVQTCGSHGVVTPKTVEAIAPSPLHVIP
jgi:hypothetical protein